MKFLPCLAWSSRFSFFPQRLNLITTSGVEPSRILVSVLTTSEIWFLDLKDGELFWTWLCPFGYLCFIYGHHMFRVTKHDVTESFLKDLPQFSTLYITSPKRRQWLSKKSQSQIQSGPSGIRMLFAALIMLQNNPLPTYPGGLIGKQL